MHILLHCGRKPEYPDRTHPAEGRGLNFHTERRSESLLCQSEKRWIRTKTETKYLRGSCWLLFSWFAFHWEQQRSLGHFRCCVFVMRVFLPLSSAVDEWLWVPLVTVNSILHQLQLWSPNTKWKTILPAIWLWLSDGRWTIAFRY